MIKRGVISFLGALALAASLQARGATIPCVTPTHCVVSLAPSQSTVLQGQDFTVAMLISAANAPGAHPGLHKGEVIIDVDPGLTYKTGSLSLGAGISPAQTLLIGSSGGRQTLTFGFLGAPDVGTVATLTFTAIGAVGSTPTIGIADNDYPGTFFNIQTTYQPYFPDFQGTSVQIVPLPGAAWLIVTAFGALVGRVRRAPRTGFTA